VGVEARLPVAMPGGAAGTGVEGLAHLVRELEGAMRPAERRAGGGVLVGAERRAVHTGRAGARRAAVADGGAATDQRGADVVFGVGERLADGAIDRLDVVAVDRLDHVPAI